MHHACLRGRVQEVCRRPMISAFGTVPWMATVHVGLPWLATATLVASSPWGDASDDVTLVATGTQQYRRGSSHATSEWGLCVTFPRDAALEAVRCRGQDHFRLIHRMRPPGQVASANRLDGVKGRGILRPPHRRGSGGLVHHQRALFHRPAIKQRRDGDMRIVWHVGHPNHLRDRALIGVRDGAC